MKLSELIYQLQFYNADAEVGVIVHNFKENFSITFGGGSEGETKINCKEVHFYVDRLCDNERKVD